jgi:hypothetical protein
MANKIRLSIGLVVLSVSLYGQFRTDLQMIQSADTIRNETVPGGNTRQRISNNFKYLVNSKVTNARTITINGTTFDLSANRSWTTNTDWGDITGKPTTIAGYGITDFNTLGDARYPQLSGSYSNPSWISSLNYSKVNFSAGNGLGLNSGSFSWGGNLIADVFVGGVGGFGTKGITFGTFGNQISYFNTYSEDGYDLRTSFGRFRFNASDGYLLDVIPGTAGLKYSSNPGSLSSLSMPPKSYVDGLVSDLLTNNQTWIGVNTFVDENFQIVDDLDNTKIAKFVANSIGTGITRLYTLPNADGEFLNSGNIVTVGGRKDFISSSLTINNPSQTFRYSFVSSAITANRNITLPLLTGNDSFVFESHIQTLGGKTLTSPVINTQISGSITSGGNITSTNYILGATATQTVSGKSLSLGSNTITTTKAQLNTAVTDGDVLYVGDVTQYTDEAAQDAVGAMIDGSLTYVDGTPLLQRSALTGAITAGAGSNTTALGSFTSDALNTAVSDKSRTITSGADAVVQADNGRTLYINYSGTTTLLVDILALDTQIGILNIGTGDLSIQSGTATVTTTLVLSGESAAIIYQTTSTPIVISSDGSFGSTNTDPGIKHEESSDFLSPLAGGDNGFVWLSNGTGATTVISDYGVNSTENAFGVISQTTGTTATGETHWYNGGAGGGINLIRFGSQALDWYWRSAISAVSDGTNTYSITNGFGEQVTSKDQNEGAYFTYTHSVNGGRWQCVTASGGTRTTTDSGVSASTSYQQFRIVVNQSGTEVLFYIDGSLVATHTTNIPTANTALVSNIVKSAGNTSRVQYVDYYKLIVTRTSLR